MIETVNSIGHVVSNYTRTDVTSAKTIIEHVKYIEDRGVQRVEVNSFVTYNKNGEEIKPSLPVGERIDIKA